MVFRDYMCVMHPYKAGEVLFMRDKLMRGSFLEGKACFEEALLMRLSLTLAKINWQL